MGRAFATWVGLLGLALSACSDQKIGSIEASGEDTAGAGAGDGAGDSPVPDETGDSGDAGDSGDSDDSGDTATTEDPCADAPPEELACDGEDEDCDGTPDDGEGLADCIESWPDGDGDGLAGDGEAVCQCSVPVGYATLRGDCDDGDPNRQLCRSCADILTRGLSTGDGLYAIDPDGMGSIDVDCDMTVDGGGWTRLLSMNALGMTQYDAGDILETRAAVGLPGDANHLSAAFYRLPFSESFVVDTTHGVAVASDTPWDGTPVGDTVDAHLAGTLAEADLWRVGSRTTLLLRGTATSDGEIAAGDLRVHFIVNQSEAPELAFPVNLDYRSGERHLIFDSAAGYAGARIYGDPLYDVSTTAVDETLSWWVR